MKKISLVLGAEGARSLCHIGVFRVPQEAEIEIGEIATCSMGAIIGGAYSAGVELDTVENNRLGLGNRILFRFSTGQGSNHCR